MDCTIPIQILVVRIHWSQELLKKNSSYFVAGFNCHLVHLATDKGGQVYESISSFSCEDHQCDLYYFLKGVQEEKES